MKNIGKNKNYSLTRKLRSENKSNKEFEVMLSNLSLEEVIGLKLELAAKCINYKLYGLPIWVSLPDIIKESLLIFALSATETKGEAARFLGLNRSQFKNLVKKYNIDEYYENSN